MKIDDLARTMVRLSGLEVRDENNPDGDIAIEYIGLRRGEKLYEELLIGENTTGTSHPRIFKNSRPVPLPTSSRRRLDDAIQRQDEAELQDMLRATVEGYMPGSADIPVRSRTTGSRPRTRCIEAMLPAHLALAIAVVASAAALSALLIYLLRPVLIRHLLAIPTSARRMCAPRRKALASESCWRCSLSPRRVARMGRVAGHGAALARAPCRRRMTVLGLADDARALPCPRVYRPDACRSCHSGEPAGSLRLFPDLLPLMVERALLVLGTVWFVNAVNFLDGLDWITAAQVVPMTLGIAVVQRLERCRRASALALALLGATLGFAPFNKHPAKVFLGDAGSLPIGLLLAFMLIYVAGTDPPRRCCCSLLADSTITLFRRL